MKSLATHKKLNNYNLLSMIFSTWYIYKKKEYTSLSMAILDIKNYKKRYGLFLNLKSDFII